MLGSFDGLTKDYHRIPGSRAGRGRAFVGDIALVQEGNPSLHGNVLLGRHDAATLTTHLFEAQVRPTPDAVLTESPAHLRRRRDRENGLPSIDFAIANRV
jgi:predicted DNA-binding protein with PD1-like motif